ncbi:tRNA dihydrouridine(20/20a) synthase DusA [Marinicella litoralis]|uniref:tRNA-dihydrouridine(20/20a) synthase n=1 Tax=Marinicella litoralis TaxID=644220 RepID=A0A4R6XN61_9GAMM|nr:tRNA dihydrouridine(20/20a) synthase DusA [Marinicella litoralis]TDR19570.1 tRNA-U16,U17-dihydrouridine synthase [Marinicella litoralis]
MNAVINDVIDRRLSVAPMLDWTDRHCRFFHRLISDQVLLYTEMITTGALLNGDQEKLLGFSPSEEPVAIQLGGSNLDDLATCAKMAEDMGYSEVNLNVGCPSDRVQKGRFGACLMKEPDLVADCFAAMQKAVKIPVTIKSRIGVDDDDSFDSFERFVDTVSSAGCQTFVVHARKALLKGLSPKQNRSVPPLKYEYAYDIKSKNPNLNVVLNGGIETVEQAVEQLNHVDGVMVGRAFWNAPWLIRDMHNAMAMGEQKLTRDEVLLAYVDYCQHMVKQGLSLHWLIRPILGLYHGFPGNKKWKSHLVTEAPRRKDDVTVIKEARDWVTYAG